MSWRRLPAPSLHDEFSNLLAADTLMHGRLSNPALELWQPFQSFHVLVRPSYASKYPLGPGALFAVGWLMFGVPAGGIWLGAALCASAMTWAAAGCMPKRWAVLSGLLIGLSPNVHHHWSLCYMNGWLTAASAALAAGAALRMRKHVRRRDALLLGIGLAGLALTRPFEGLVFALTLLALLAFWWRHLPWQSKLVSTWQLALSAAVPLSAALALIGCHNAATTGCPWRMPYQLHEAQYGVAPLSVLQAVQRPQMMDWLDDVPPALLEYHYGWSLQSYLKRNHLSGWCAAVAERFHVVFQLWGWLFCLVGASMLLSRRGPYWPFGAAISVALLAGTLVPWYFSHYFAPSLVWLVILTTVGWQWILKRIVSDRQTLNWAACALVAVQSIAMGAELVRANQRPETWADLRQAIQTSLDAAGGKHLVLVKYLADHNVHHEWVYNGADLEKATVLWSRSWREDLDNELFERFIHHQIWLIEIDKYDRANVQLLREARGPKEEPTVAITKAASLR